MKIKEELYLVKDALISLVAFFFLTLGPFACSFLESHGYFVLGFLILYSGLSWARKLQKKATDGAKNCSIEVMSRPYYI